MNWDSELKKMFIKNISMSNCFDSVYFKKQFSHKNLVERVLVINNTNC